MKPMLNLARRAALGAAAGLLPLMALGGPLNLTQVPLYLSTLVKPNVLSVRDNSESMDGTMAGQLIAGSDPTTRGNTARSVIRNAVTAFQTSFNWGLETFGLSDGPWLNTTYAYFFGNDQQVVYTNDCVAGISLSNGGLRCVANPEPAANGYSYITYEYTGDDPEINDVLYTQFYGNQLYGIGVPNSTSYYVYANHGPTTGWSSTDLQNQLGNGAWTFSPTDAGYLPATPPNDRMFWLLRAWGYYADITGMGQLLQPVAPSSNAQIGALMSYLGNETNGATGEIKNAAVFTPLSGSFQTARSYFAGQLAGTSSPITASCQRNFVLLATDGNPTGQTSGQMWSLAQQQNTYNAATNTWSFSTAANDVFNSVSSLRALAYNANNYDVQTYVVGLGDTVANPASVATLNQIANLGGTNHAYLASNQAALAAAFNSISVDIVARTSAASSVSVNSGAWNNGTNLYQGRFNSGDWSGQLLQFPILGTGAVGANANWDAGQLLNSNNWNTGRQILTYKPSAALGSRGVAFRWPANPSAPQANEIDAGMVAALNTSLAGAVDGYGAQRLAWLRGNTALELRNCGGCAAPTFRNRASTVLGDIVNSAPLYIGGPSSSYRDNIASVPYSSYAASRTAQTPMIYVGANDGMLHAFNANTGAEVFAYVPWAVRNRLSALPDPAYTHLYTVDGSPSVFDAFYAGAWHSLLVSGMNAGAQGLFALDVTQAPSVTEANGAAVPRWEIDGSDPDVGYIFSKPVLVPLRDGSWRVLVGNGYNSSNGHAVLLMIDVQTGAISRIDTLAGSAAAPNGLSGLVTVSKTGNGIVDYVYAGDLNGNLWKFDLSAAAPANWKVAYGNAGAPQPLFTTAAGQPITGRPDVTLTAAGQYLVTFGTGRYIDVSDTAAGAQQALYGIVDGGAPVAMASLQVQTIDTTSVANNNTWRLTTHAVGPSTDGITLAGDNQISVNQYRSAKGGWVLTLPAGGERVVADATIRYGRVTFSSLVPSTVVCSSGGSGWLTTLDVLTGNRSPAFDVNGDGTINANDLVLGMTPSSVQISSIPAAATTIRGENRHYDNNLVNTSGGTVLPIQTLGNQKNSSRASWEQIK
ncbi:MAG: pilus assembly protein PilY [Burkholderiales bacterium]|nr:pilus assembly protein PilY [Burkholderiales bacterium]